MGTAEPRAATTNGWAWPLRSRKAHYFVNATSLCGKWMYTGRLDPNQKQKSKDDCVSCGRKLDAAAPKTESNRG